MAEISEDSSGVDARVQFVTASGNPAKIDGDPRWSLGNDEDGNPVGTLQVDPGDPFSAFIEPLPVPEGVDFAHTAQGFVEGDADRDAGEERIIREPFVFTVRRAEAQSASVTMTERVE